MKKIFLLFAMILTVVSINADESDGKTVTLVTSGTGTTKELATRNALRSAIEQTYGTFVSANTELVNDELVKDEIVSISSGNIEKFTELSQETLPNGKINVSVKATVSIGKLIKYAESKGASAELAGATFLMNTRIKELNKKNTEKALTNMYKKMFWIFTELNLFDYSLKVGDPYKAGDMYCVPVKVSVVPNQNHKNLRLEFINTIKALMLSNSEVEDYKRANIKTYGFESTIYRDLGDIFDPKTLEKMGNWYRFNWFSGPQLAAKPNEDFLKNMEKAIICSSFAFKITDNLGNESVTCKNYIDNRRDDTHCGTPLFFDGNYLGLADYGCMYGLIAKDKENEDNNFLGKNKKSRNIKYESYSNKHPVFHKIDASGMLLSSGIPQVPCSPIEINLYYSESDIAKLKKIDISPVKLSSIIVRDFTK